MYSFLLSSETPNDHFPNQSHFTSRDSVAHGIPAWEDFISPFLLYLSWIETQTMERLCHNPAIPGAGCTNAVSSLAHRENSTLRDIHLLWWSVFQRDGLPPTHVKYEGITPNRTEVISIFGIRFFWPKKNGLWKLYMEPL